ncbi:MAG: hypothetical protein Q7S74_03060 [Nanoarchaeota archaeon]|nr:hypothetical protein [Nanoarchaeota archaeon]
MQDRKSLLYFARFFPQEKRSEEPEDLYAIIVINHPWEERLIGIDEGIVVQCIKEFARMNSEGLVTNGIPLRIYNNNWHLEGKLRKLDRKTLENLTKTAQIPLDYINGVPRFYQ